MNSLVFTRKWGDSGIGERKIKRSNGIMADIPDIHRQSNQSPRQLLNNIPIVIFAEKKNPTVPRKLGVVISP